MIYSLPRFPKIKKNKIEISQKVFGTVWAPNTKIQRIDNTEILRLENYFCFICFQKIYNRPIEVFEQFGDLDQRSSIFVKLFEN